MKNDLYNSNGKKFFINIPTIVRYDTSLKAGTRLIFEEIAILADKRGYCWATNLYFAELYDIDPKTVSRAINDLIQAGYIISETQFDNNDFSTRRQLYLTKKAFGVAMQKELKLDKPSRLKSNDANPLTKSTRDIFVHSDQKPRKSDKVDKTIPSGDSNVPDIINPLNRVFINKKQVSRTARPLPPDFVISEEVSQWIKTKFPFINQSELDEQFELFTTHFGVDGEGGKKKNWDQALKNWIRRAYEWGSFSKRKFGKEAVSERVVPSSTKCIFCGVPGKPCPRHSKRERQGEFEKI